MSCCGAMALAVEKSAAGEPLEAADETVLLALPSIHCAGCIAGVERTLGAAPGVKSARVNLSLKRVAVRASDWVTAQSLIERLDRAGYEALELDQAVLQSGADDHVGRALMLRLGVSGFAMMNVMLLSVSVWSGAEAATRDFMHWVSALIALPAVAYSAQPFFRNAVTALRGWRLNMDVPISLAIILAAGMSLYETAASGPHAYFDAALSLTFFLLLGRYLDHGARAAARSAARELTALESPKAIRLRDGEGSRTEETVPVSALAVGDLLRLAPGMRAPVDGVIESGESDMDRAHLTGESAPVPAGPGAAVAAGEMNLTGMLTLRASAVGEDTSLRRMASLVAAAERGRGRYQTLADQAARIYAPLVHALALIAFIGWMIGTGDWRFSLNVAVAVLIITCPCALGLAAPAVATTAAGRLFRRGVLLKTGAALERLAQVDMVVFDKTGTLTTGAPRLVTAPDAETLAAAAALAEGSAHPYAKAVLEAARERGVAPLAATGLREVPGRGIEGVLMEGPLAGRSARLGRADWIGAEDAEGAASWLAVDGAAPARFAFKDSYREGAAALVTTLKARGIETLLLSGDGEAAVRDAAATLGIDHAEARMTPEGKLARLEALRDQGRKTLMVGDGLNDAGALAAAHVSAAPGSALDAARVASDIVLLRGELGALGAAMLTAESARRRILENFAIAALYNVVAVPIAFAGFATPLIAALAMSISSITVSLNALRLK